MGQDLRKTLGSEIMPAAAHQLLMAEVQAHAISAAAQDSSERVRDRINRGEFPVPPFMSPALSFNMSRIRAKSFIAGA
jgi:hypothetical protein